MESAISLEMGSWTETAHEQHIRRVATVLQLALEVRTALHETACDGPRGCSVVADGDTIPVTTNSNPSLTLQTDW